MLGISVSTLKTACRKLGVRSWPHRYQDFIARSGRGEHAETDTPSSTPRALGLRRDEDDDDLCEIVEQTAERPRTDEDTAGEIAEAPEASAPTDAPRARVLGTEEEREELELMALLRLSKEVWEDGWSAPRGFAREQSVFAHESGAGACGSEEANGWLVWPVDANSAPPAWIGFRA